MSFARCFVAPLLPQDDVVMRATIVHAAQSVEALPHACRTLQKLQIATKLSKRNVITHQTTTELLYVTSGTRQSLLLVARPACERAHHARGHCNFCLSAAAVRGRDVRGRAVPWRLAFLP
jgi:hypothetical protein